MSLLLFSKNKISETSVDNGETNIDLYAVPISSLVNVTSTQTIVTLYFRDGGSYTSFTGGTTNVRAYEFTQVDLQVKPDTEKEVIITLSKLLTEYKNGSINSIVIDEISGNISIPNVESIISIKRFDDLSTLTTDPAAVTSIPTGGDIDQVLTKLSSTDGDVDWEYLQDIYLIVENASGGTLGKGTPVHITGENGNGNPTVIAARADTPSTMPANFILAEAIVNGAEGIAFLIGRIQGVNTSSFSAGDVVYVGPTGGYTTTKPTGTNLIQNLGIVTAVDATNGGGWIYGAGRSNDIPNLPTGKFFIGSATNTLESAYTLPTADGTSGQVLATDGAGAVTFQTPSASADRFVFTGLASVDTAAAERFIPLSSGVVDISTNDIRMAAIVPVDADIEKIAIVASTSTTNTVTVRMYKNYVLASTNSSVSLAANVSQVLTPTATSFTAGDAISVSIEQDSPAVDLNYINITVSLTT